MKINSKNIFNESPEINNGDKFSGVRISNTDPTTTDDFNSGFYIGYSWINTANTKTFICNSSVVSAATWTHVINNENNTVVVNSLSDLPAPSGNEILLDGNTEYKIFGTLITGTNKLRCQEKTVVSGGNSKSISTIIYTGSDSTFCGNEISARIKDLTISSKRAFNFINTGGTKSMILKDNIITGQLSASTVNGFYVHDSYNNFYINNNDAISFTDINYLSTFKNTFVHNSGTSISINSGTYEGITIIANNFDINNPGVGINIDLSGITINDEVMISSNGFIGNSSAMTKGFNILDGVIHSSSNIGIDNNDPHTEITTTQMNLISSPTNGLVLLNSDTNGLVYYNGVEFRQITDDIILTTIFSEDCESGSYSTNGWTLVNDTTNKWEVGTAEAAFGTYGFYISDDGGTTSTYTNNVSQVSHFYKDIALPSGATKIYLEFYWKCEGEVNYDAGQVYDAPTSVTPVAGVSLGATNRIGLSQYNNNTVFTSESIALDAAEAGTTRRFIFSFINDSSLGISPAFCLDNIKVLYN